MGTRSMVHFQEQLSDKHDPVTYLSVYQQYDGYIEGVGQDLAQFLVTGKLVNGIPCGDDINVYFNGLGCLAAQFVSEFKNGAGNLYIEQPNDSLREEYNYFVRVVHDGESLGNGRIEVACEELNDGKFYSPEQFLEAVSNYIDGE